MCEVHTDRISLQNDMKTMVGLKVLFGLFVLLGLLSLLTPSTVEASCPRWLEFWGCALFAYAVGWGEGKSSPRPPKPPAPPNFYGE